MGYLPIYLDSKFSLVRENKWQRNRKACFFKKLRKGLSVVRDVLDVKVLYYVQLKYFVDKVCRRDHGLSFKKNLALFNVSTLRYKRNKINAKLCPTRYICMVNFV